MDQSLHSVGSSLKFEGDKIKIRRSTSGPAITLNVEWRNERLGIDIVVCLKAADVGNR